jgi:hypothetical protein
MSEMKRLLEWQAGEIQLYTENDFDMYKDFLVPYYQNLEKKMAKNIYDKEKATKGMQKILNIAYRKYCKEIYPEPISPLARRMASEEMIENFEIEKQAGNSWLP